MAADGVSLVAFYFRFANLLVSAYLFKVLFDMVRRRQTGKFSKTIYIMIVLVGLFFVVEAMQIYSMFSSQEAEIIAVAFSFAFLLLLLSVTLHLRSTLLAHEHLVRHRHRQHLTDVE
ncbi:MAG: hypothetical protein N3G22_03530 [Candidatus Micrarchaeota archaeon]|nr:hypothetical protein [Candidatus Micrarchaeota archaeon]